MTPSLAALALALLAANPASAISVSEQPPPEAACCVAFLPKSNSFVYGTVGGHVCVSGAESRILHEAKGPVGALAVSPDGQAVACCFYGAPSGDWGFVVVLDIKNRRQAVQHLSREILRGLRAVEALERINTSESRKILAELTNGEPEARLTHEAKAALARITRK